MKQAIKIAFRNFRNKPVTYMINIFGLSLSLTFVFILSVYCYTEFTADTHHPDSERIFFLFNKNEVNSYGGVTPGVLKSNIELKIPDIQKTLRIRSSWLSATLKTDSNEPITTDLVYTDETFFDFFNYRCIEGNLETALDDPMSLVLLKSEAEKLFGTSQALGKTVLLNTKYPLTVTAIVEPLKKQSFLRVKAVSPVSTIKSINYDYSEGDYSNWGQRNFLTFVKLENNLNATQVAEKITMLFPEEYKKNTMIALMPLQDVYLNSCGLDKVLGFFSFIQKGNKSQLFVLLVVAGLILFIALVNYINISSSQRLETIKQAGMQKLIGASRLQIFSGIVAEAELIFLGASVFAFVFSIAVIPFIARYVGINLNTRDLLSPIFIGAAVLATIMVGFLVCIVPAIQQSKARSLDLIKDLNTAGKGKFSLQRLNVAAQFTIAIMLIAFTLFVFKQIKFGFSTIGYDEDSRIAIKFNDQLYSKSDVLKEQILKLPEATNASVTKFYPGKSGVNMNNGELTNNYGEKILIGVSWMSADADFLEALNLNLIEGDFYKNWNTADESKIVVNETFIKEHGISSNPIGARVNFQHMDHEIIGVIRDFHLNTVNVPILPLVLTNKKRSNKGFPYYMIVKLHLSDPGKLHETVENIKNISSSVSPDYPVEVSFLDTAIGEMYEGEVRFRQVFSLFAGSSIFISCLGIFAMSLFDSRRRIKEIGIRKVNGAKVSEILTMLNKDFVTWVVVAFVIATPVAYYAMSKWLENFAYKTNLSWWIFALSGVLALGIALLTVSWQSWRAATRNPVEALRYE